MTSVNSEVTEFDTTGGDCEGDITTGSTTTAVTTFTFSDDVIGNVAKVLQIGLLTGTDIVDHLRRIETTSDSSGKLVLTDNYTSMFEHWLSQMLEKLESEQQNNSQFQVEEGNSLFE